MIVGMQTGLPICYYFHLRIGPTLSPDEIGLDLPDLETAYLEAFKAAQEMWPELLTERCLRDCR
jgi:hypothetical protein